MIDESWYARPAGVPEHDAAGGVIVRQEKGKLYVALVCEGEYEEYILPKGHVEAGETPEGAARREIMEESGLTDLTLIGRLGIRARLDYSRTSWKKTHYFLFLTSQTVGHPTDRYHDYVLEWHPLDDLPKLFWPEQRELIEVNRARIQRAAAQAA
jgi:8-oxo-dGTP pyrophosphatase MutT (NUDIX family)